MDARRWHRVPWFLAGAGLTVPLVGSGFSLWGPIAVWAAGLVVVWALSRVTPFTRDERLVLAVVLLPILFAAAFQGGWWLIPANLAWIVTELTGQSRTATSN